MGKGGDKYNNGGIIDVNDDWASGIDLGAKAVGFYFGGPGGASMASMGSKVLFGNDSDGSSTIGKVNKGADMLTMVGGVAGAMNSGTGTAAGEVSKGFSGTTTAGKGVDVGGTNAFGNPLGTGKDGMDLNKAITGSGDMMNKIKKAIDAKDQVGALLGRSKQNPNPQILMQPDTSINPAEGIQSVPQLNQILAAQLINPAQNQNRLAFRRFA